MIGELYHEMVSRPRARVLRNHLVEMIPPEARILDVGCGDGLLASLILEKRPDVSLSGIDVLVQPHAQIPVELYDGRSIPHPDRSFDAVLLVDVLHHTEDPVVLLREGSRVARDCVIVKDHNRDNLAAGARLRFMDWLGNSRHSIALTYNYWPQWRWQSTFAELGFNMTEYRENLGLYPPPAKWLFDGSLHFISRLGVNAKRSK